MTVGENLNEVGVMMGKSIKISIGIDINEQYTRILALEQDYELASLSEALKQNDTKEIERSKARLKGIHDELTYLEVYC